LTGENFYKHYTCLWTGHLMDTRGAAVRIWVGLWYIAYVVLRVLLRLLMGKRRRSWVLSLLGLHYSRGYSVKYGSLFSRYEPAVSRVVRKVLGNNRSRTFIDVGAFIGYYTLYAYSILRKKGEVFSIVAVEPEPRNYEILRNRVVSIQNIMLVNEAVFIKDGETVEFQIGTSRVWLDDLADAGSVSPTMWHVKEGFLSGEKIRVQSVRLDTLIRRFGFERVDLVKMDIEGAEYPVLTDPSLDLSKVENMVVEVHYGFGSRESREIMRALAMHGFKIVPLYPNQTSDRYYTLLACRGELSW